MRDVRAALASRAGLGFLQGHGCRLPLIEWNQRTARPAGVWPKPHEPTQRACAQLTRDRARPDCFQAMLCSRERAPRGTDHSSAQSPGWRHVGLMKVVHDWYWARGQAGPYSVIASYITSAKRYGFEPIPIFMLVRDDVL